MPEEQVEKSRPAAGLYSAALSVTLPGRRQMTSAHVLVWGMFWLCFPTVGGSGDIFIYAAEW